MIMKKINLLIFIIFTCLSFGQQDIALLEQEFDELAKEQPGLNERLESEASGITLAALLSSIAYEHKITVEVDPALNTPIEVNYHDRPVKEIFLYLIQRHDIEVKILHNVIIFSKKAPVVIPQKKWTPKPLDISYNEEEGTLSVNFKNDSLPRVAKAITKVTKRNVVVAPDLKQKVVSGYFQNRPIEEILEMVGQANDIIISKNKNGSYFLENNYAVNGNGQTNNPAPRRSSKKYRGQPGFYDVSLANNGFLILEADEAPLSDIIKEATALLNLNYYFYGKIEGVTTIKANEITFDELLETIFRGKDYTYNKNKKGFYFIGKRDQEGLRSTKLIKLQNRTIDTVLQTIPKELTKGLEVKEFKELNGLVVSGSLPKINELEGYINEIDQVVPMVQLEVFIVQYNKSHGIQTGMKAGLDNKNRTTQGVLFPTTDVQLNDKSVNNLIDIFNGFGIGTLGKVTSQFYLDLKFLENNSIIKMESTSKLATLSGHDAELKIGETSYYAVEQSNFTPLGNTNNFTQIKNWKDTEANLNVKITPQVSEDEQVTLTITVEKSSFLAKAEESAPPGKATQFFKTEIRMRNNEMAFLGGLDELKADDTGKGVPVISRIPVLKWFFSGRNKQKSKSKLHLLIKPTITH